ncbi:MAG: hypothetical protein ACI4EQ_03610 [Lachnospiraceae bacterium]
MKRVQKGLFWFYLTCKRLIKKRSFFLLLCSIPILVLAMRLVSKEESGMLKIVLFQENTEDELSSKMMADLLTEESVLQYEQVYSEEEAYRAVMSAEADAAWIFPDKMQNKLDEYIAGAYDQAVIKIVEREDNVALQLSREKLYGALYSYFPYSVYQNFIQSELPGGKEASEEELYSYYEESRVEGELFKLSFINGGDNEMKPAEQNYLTAPVRGLLSLMVILSGLAATMYFLQDEEAGVFDRVALRDRHKYLYGYQIAAMVYTGAAVLLALFFSESFMGIQEAGFMLLYVLMNVGFCSIIKTVCKNLQRLGTCIPLLMIGMLVLCPVFFAVRRFRMLQYLLPPFYYLNVIHNRSYIPQMLLYCFVTFCIKFLLDKMLERLQK